MPLTTIVTGAASGIGLISARLLNSEGHNVMAFDLNERKMRSELGDLPNIIFYPGDVANHNDCSLAVEATLNAFGQLNGVLHWAAKHSSKRWDQVSINEFNDIMTVNVTGSFLISKAAAKEMIKRDGGSIVLTTSTSIIHGAAGGEGQGGPAYVSSKGAIVALNRSLARSFAPKVRCNAISPGLTETPMISGMTDELRDKMLERFPMKRFGTPKEIANAGIFLLSEKASFITGEVLHVNGGSNFS